MKGPTHNRFHFLAINFLRDTMDVQTDVLPTNKVADPNDPEHARISGQVFAETYRSKLGYIALMLLIVAGCVGMGSIRPGIGATVSLGLQIATVASVAVSVALLVVDAIRRRRAARPVDVVINASASESGAVDVAKIAKWHADAHGQLWVVSERGFSSDALALASKHGIRCFTKVKRGFEEVRASTLVSVPAAHREAA